MPCPKGYIGRNQLAENPYQQSRLLRAGLILVQETAKIQALTLLEWVLITYYQERDLQIVTNRINCGAED
jgi:hypothetical protein